MPFKKVIELRRSGSTAYDMGVVFFCWLGVFAMGVSVPSEPFRRMVVSTCYEFGEVATVGPSTAPTPPASQPAQNEHARAVDPPKPPPPAVYTLKGWELLLMPLVLVVIFLSYTPTNLVMLCIFGSMLGSLAFRVAAERCKVPEEVKNRRVNIKGHRGAGTIEAEYPPTVTAMVHGLCIFLGIIGGLIVIQGNLKFDSAEPDLYFRVAAAATLFSIAAGTNKNFIRDLTKAFRPFANGDGAAGAAKTS
jgi:hypothetical protein